MSDLTKSRHTPRLICCAVVMLLVPPRASGSDDGCLRERSRFPVGAIGAIAADLPYLISGSGTALVIDDVVDPTRPQRLGTLDLRSPILDLALQGRIAFAGTEEGLHIIDTRNPRAPRSLSFVATEHPARGVAVHGWRAWVVGRIDEFTRGGSTLIHVGQPETPWVISSEIESSCAPADVALQYPILVFVGCSLEIFDLSQSSHIPVGGSGISGYAVAIDGTNVAVTGYSDFQIIDIGDPSKPVAKGGIWTRGEATDVVLSAGLAVGSSRTGLTIADIASTGAPSEVFFASFLGGVSSIAITDELLFAAHRGGLNILSLDDPAAPSELSKAGDSLFNRVAVSGRLAIAQVLGNGPGEADLTVFDIGRRTPTAVGSWRSIYGVDDVNLVGDTAFVTADFGLYALDLSDPTHPVELDFVDLSESQHLAVDSGRAYVATSEVSGYSNFRIVDVSDPTDLRPAGGVGWDRGWVTPTAVAAENDIAVVAEYRGLRIIDVSDPQHADEIGFWEREGGTSAAVVGRLAVLGFASHDELRTTGIDVIDVYSPDGPRAIATWASPSAVTAVAEYGGNVLVGTVSDGVYLIDVSNPADPRPVDRWYADHLSTTDLGAGWPLIVQSCYGLGLTVLGLDRRCMRPRRPSSRAAPAVNTSRVTSTPSRTGRTHPLESSDGSAAAKRAPAGRAPL